MRILRMTGVTLAAIIGLMLSGCAQMAITGAPDVNKKAFGANKRFAVVSIASLKTFQGEQGLAQKFQSNDNIPGVNTQPIINKLRPKIIGAFSRTRNFTLVSEDAVLASSAYRNIAEDEKVMKILFITEPINTATSYKYVSNEQKYAKLAKDLGVDGVIGVTMNFTVNEGGGKFYLGPLSLGKKSYSAMASISAVAYDRSGQVIWKDSTMKEAEPGDSKAIVLLDTSGMTDTLFEKLHPSAVEIGGKAVDVLVARLDDTMAGREVSRIQSVK